MFLRITRLFYNHWALGNNTGSKGEPLTLSGYLICIKLSFLAETWRHVLGLDLLLGHVVLVLVKEMLVLNLLNECGDRECLRQ